MKKDDLFPLLICVVVALCASYPIQLLLLSATSKGIILMLFTLDCLSVALLVTLVWLVTCYMTSPQDGSIHTQVETQEETPIVETRGSLMKNPETSKRQQTNEEKHNV